MDDGTWTLTVDGVAYAIDRNLATRIMTGAAKTPSVGRFDVHVPGSDEPVWIDLDSPETWSLSRQD